MRAQPLALPGWVHWSVLVLLPFERDRGVFLDRSQTTHIKGLYVKSIITSGRIQYIADVFLLLITPPCFGFLRLSCRFRFWRKWKKVFVCQQLDMLNIAKTFFRGRLWIICVSVTHWRFPKESHWLLCLRVDARTINCSSVYSRPVFSYSKLFQKLLIHRRRLALLKTKRLKNALNFHFVVTT